MQFSLNKELLHSLRDWIAEGKDSVIAKSVAEAHPADIAELINQLRTVEAVYLYRLLDEQLAADVMLELDEDVRERLLSNLTSREIAEELIENIDSDDAADVISELPEQKQEEVIALLEDEEQASDIIDLMTYPEGTAGALMGTELVKVNYHWNVAQAIREMRKQAEDLDNIYTIYVVDDQERVLGTLSVKYMLFNVSSLRSSIKDLFKEEKVRSVIASTPAEEVARIMDKYDLVALPVVDERGVLLGRITIDDVVDVIKEEADKDYQMASGISEDVEYSDNIITLTRARLPWLLIGMGGGMVSANIIGVFDISTRPEMAIFMPLIAAMGGNVGIQSAALVVKALANSSVLDETLWQKLWKELRVGIINGVVCSIVILAVSLLFRMDLSLCITAGVALFFVILFASFFGTWIPMTLNRFGIDPALATGPFVTTLNDIFGLIIYFSVGHYWMDRIDAVQWTAVVFENYINIF